MKRTTLGLLALAGTLLLPGTAPAHITSITISSQESPTFGGTSFGAVGQYEKLIARVTGEVDPGDPRNQVIVDIQNAPRNANHMVEYSTDILILRPTDPTKGNRRLIFDVTNRGNISGFPIYVSSSTGNNPTTAADAGNGYLMRQGYLVVIGGWDFSAPCAAPPDCGPDKGSKNFTTSVPVATNPDGSSIVGLNSEELVVDTGASPSTLSLTYPAATLDKSQASLTVRQHYADTPTLIPASGWAYTSNAGKAIKLVPGPFVATNLYEFTYPAKDPVVAGLGLAAIRDVATFLRDGTDDGTGPVNPLAGLVDFMYSICSSQPCRTMRDFVYLGFNEADSGPFPVGNGQGKGSAKKVDHVQVFDGVLNWKAGGSGIFLNYRFSQPVRTHRQHIARWTPEIQFPFADETIVDHVTKQKAGRLERCKATKTCPKIFEANSANEFWAKAASNLLTDAKGHDLKLKDPNVAYYLQSSSPHGAASGLGICAYPRNPLPPDQFLRGLLVALDQWVTAGVEPPADRIPTVKDGTLVPTLPQAGQGFPNIPGVTYNGINHTGDLFDFGPRFDQGILDTLPPVLLGTPYPALVPRTDADGNDIAGVRMPDIAVPTATYTGWNLRAAFAADLAHADGCDASGLKIDFPADQAARLATGDPRRSIKERYPTHQTYVDAVTAAANALRDEGFLIQEDVDAYISAAQASGI